jgi:hypothetical protein
MELLLNLAWLLLAMPAFWLWRECRNPSAQRRFTPLQCLLALACVLVILFPVVSATDDLRAMRAEFEESPTKRSVCQSSGERPCTSKWQSQPALSVASHSQFASHESWYHAPVSRVSIWIPPLNLRSGRDPPEPSRA